jgi:hypothetical protein
MKKKIDMEAIANECIGYELMHGCFKRRPGQKWVVTYGIKFGLDAERKYKWNIEDPEKAWLLGILAKLYKDKKTETEAEAELGNMFDLARIWEREGAELLRLDHERERSLQFRILSIAEKK